MAALQIPVPDTTSAETFERHVGGKCLVACRGEAWRDIQACIIAPLREAANGLTRAQVLELLARLAFYSGWPNVFSAVPVVKSVFESRPA